MEREEYLKLKKDIRKNLDDVAKLKEKLLRDEIEILNSKVRSLELENACLRRKLIYFENTQQNSKIR